MHVHTVPTWTSCTWQWPRVSDANEFYWLILSRMIKTRMKVTPILYFIVDQGRFCVVAWQALREALLLEFISWFIKAETILSLVFLYFTDNVDFRPLSCLCIVITFNRSTVNRLDDIIEAINLNGLRQEENQQNNWKLNHMYIGRRRRRDDGWEASENRTKWQTALKGKETDNCMGKYRFHSLSWST